MAQRPCSPAWQAAPWVRSRGELAGRRKSGCHYSANIVLPVPKPASLQPLLGAVDQGEAPRQPAGLSKPFDQPEVWACLSHPQPGEGKPMAAPGVVTHRGGGGAAPQGGAAGGGFSGLSTQPAGGHGPHTQLWPAAGCGPPGAPGGRGKPGPGAPRHRLTCWDRAPVCPAHRHVCTAPLGAGAPEARRFPAGPALPSLRLCRPRPLQLLSRPGQASFNQKPASRRGKPESS